MYLKIVDNSRVKEVKIFNFDMKNSLRVLRRSVLTVAGIRYKKGDKVYVQLVSNRAGLGSNKVVNVRGTHGILVKRRQSYSSDPIGTRVLGLVSRSLINNPKVLAICMNYV